MARVVTSSICLCMVFYLRRNCSRLVSPIPSCPHQGLALFACFSLLSRVRSTQTRIDLRALDIVGSEWNLWGSLLPDTRSNRHPSSARRGLQGDPMDPIALFEQWVRSDNNWYNAGTSYHNPCMRYDDRVEQPSTCGSDDEV